MIQAAKGLESLGISLEAVRGQVEELIGQGASSPSGHIPFTPRAKKVLELSALYYNKTGSSEEYLAKVKLKVKSRSGGRHQTPKTGGVFFICCYFLFKTKTIRIFLLKTRF